MEHLDLAGYITTPTYWTMPAFEQQDAIYLSNSRQMLEPIQEETSEDEEHAQNSWQQYEQSQNFWSSAESDTGSVIRIELNKDADSISERDFACPPKRARHSDDFAALGTFNNSQPSSLDDTVILRRHHRPYTDSEATNSLERFLAYEAAARDSFGNQPLRNSTGSRRFDEFNPTDNDGFTSLSRSSSLVQFESLEKQLMLSEQHASMSSLGNSSPSLLSFDGATTQSSNSNLEEGARNSGNNSGNSSRRGSQSSLMKRFDASDGRLHQTYYELNKLNFDDDEQQQIQFSKLGGSGSKSSTLESGTGSSISESKSDSESSTTSDSCDSSSSAQSSILRAAADSLQQQDAQQKKNARLKSFQRAGKSSAENLSEDSGYCEPSMLSRAKSKSIPKNFEKFCEEDEEDEDAERFQNFSDDEERVDEDDVELSEDNQHSRHDNGIFEKASSALDATFTVTAECMELVEHINNSVETASASEASAAVPHTFFYAKNSLDEMSSVDIAAAECSLPSSSSAHVDCIRSHTNTDTHTRLDSPHSHSPSPDSSLGSSHSTQSTQSTRSSTTTAETCASAGSFTWHHRQQHLAEREDDNEQPSPHYTNFFASHRNSLPDIREACTTELGTTYSTTSNSTATSSTTNSSSSTATSQSSSPLSATTACRNRLDEFDDGFVNYSNKNVLEGPEDENSIGSKNLIEQFVDRGRCAARHSLPNELNKLGRRKKRVGRQSKQHQQQQQQAQQLNAYDSSSSGTESDYFVALDEDQQKLRRSCSWSERQSKNSQAATTEHPKSAKEDLIFGKLLEDEPQQTALSFGYMNASYHNLTLLDYSEKPSLRSTLSNIKRSGIDMSSNRHSSKDYEDIICKGNFLLDELSEIYDRNASILNDKPIADATLLEEETTDSSSGEGSYVERLETCVEQLIVAPTKESLASTIPKPPPRQRSTALSTTIAASEVLEGDDYSEAGQVQHVQLTIRKPPARQKRNGVQTNSMQESENPIFSTFGKTFDQDPTNLRTSYAQSLEKCNFDAKEVSTGDLKPRASMPKRRFHSQANATKKRNMVSSTPNLNAFDPRADELEDDIYVSSAHNSMHQLPQSQVQKPLGILLPAGSRSSFGKEVSFCPVVSKYCWQEQSSEECNEPGANSVEDETDELNSSASSAPANGHDMLAKAEESSDDELLDNADATVIYNTKENELIAERYNEEQQQKQQQEQMQLRESASKEQQENEQLREQAQESKTRAQEISAQMIASEQRATSENIATSTTTSPPSKQATASESLEKRVSNTQQPPPAQQQVTSISTTTISQVSATNQVTSQSGASVSVKQRHKNAVGTQNSTQSEVKNQSRPFSLQLPILSEPPINREHHILYASQQMLDHFQRQEQQAAELERQYQGKQVSQSVQNLSANNSNLFKQKAKMSMLKSKSSGGDGEVLGADGSALKPHNNNNEVMKTKFKADEKHPNSKGFFTRFANGFRFSLRRNKNKKLQQQQQQQQVEHVKTLEPQLTITPVAVNGGSQKAKKGQQPTGNKQEQQQKQSQKSSSTSTSSQQQQANPTTTSTNENFIYIPLKGPLPADYKRAGTTTSGNTSNNSQSHNTSQASTASAKSQQQIGGKTLTDNNQNNGKVLGKPPIPKQPPRATTLAGYGQSAATNSAAAQQHLSYYYQQQQGDEVDLATTANFTTQALLDSERSFYYDDFKNQLNSGGMHANNELQAFAAAAGGVGIASTSSPSRGSVSQKTQMFNQLGGNGGHQATAAQNGRNAAASKIGLIETDLDTHETVITGKTRSLMDITSGPHGNKRFVIDKRLHIAGGDNVDIDGCVGGGSDAYDGYANDGVDEDYEVMVDANGVVVSKKTTSSGNHQIASVRRPHKSMEFLLDKENQKNVLPPENELQKSHEHNPAALSEHQLRVQASLQRLNIPDWFRQYNQSQSTTTARSPDGANSTTLASATSYKPGNFTRKRTNESGRWVGLNSKTTSLSSLGSQRSDRSPLLLSPSAHSHHGGQTTAQTGTTGVGVTTTGAHATRWSTSHLNSTQTSPSVSQRGSFTRGGPVNSSFISVASGNSGNSVIRSSYRQPYLGWRSTEKLSQRTPHERLATSLLAQQQRTSPTQRLTTTTTNGVQQPVTPEIQSSIKEVTSAIVHYVNDQTNQQRSRSASPNSRKCWLESSFVGIRPLDSPQTPVIEGETPFQTAGATTTTATAINNNNNILSYIQQQQLLSNNLIQSERAAATTTGAAATADVRLRMNGSIKTIAGGEFQNAAAATTATTAAQVNSNAEKLNDLKKTKRASFFTQKHFILNI